MNDVNEYIEEIVKQLIIIRDMEMEEAPDLMKTRAGYNVNLLIEELRQKRSQVLDQVLEEAKKKEIKTMIYFEDLEEIIERLKHE